MAPLLTEWKGRNRILIKLSSASGNLLRYVVTITVSVDLLYEDINHRDLVSQNVDEHRQCAK